MFSRIHYTTNKHMYHTYTHITATALPRKKPAAKEEDDDLRELAAWASWTHLTLGGRERLSSFITCYQALAIMISVTVYIAVHNLWDIHVYLFALLTLMVIHSQKIDCLSLLLAYRLSNILDPGPWASSSWPRTCMWFLHVLQLSLLHGCKWLLFCMTSTALITEVFIVCSIFLSSCMYILPSTYSPRSISLNTEGGWHRGDGRIWLARLPFIHAQLTHILQYLTT